MSEGPQGRGEVADLLRRHGIRPRKALGQHFLVDPNLVHKIVRHAGVGPGDRVLEVGAGTGTLTRALAATGAAVVTYEIDERLRPLLTEVLEGLDIDVRFADAMDARLPQVLGTGPWTMAANLPYHVGTPLLLDLLQQAGQIERFVVMVQKEVADRLTAGPGSKAYGIPSVVTSLFASVETTFRVPPRVFLPPPDVDSAVVCLQRRPAPRDAARALELAAAAFGQRRKMLRRSLAGILADPVGLLEAIGTTPTARGEEMEPADFVRLAEAERNAG